MNYKGVEYHYAFELNLLLGNSDNGRVMDIIISKYREETQDFSGLCLENELRVISKEKMQFAAFFDIIDSIIRITAESERALFETHNEQRPSPFMTVQSPVLLEQFNRCRKSKKSLAYYDKLKRCFERPETITNKALTANITNLYDCQNLSFFYNLVRAEKMPVKDIDFFRI
jgi:hypothetical protein